MSRYYGSLNGSRGEATRQGTAKSGLEGHIRGWDIGARVEMSRRPDGDDEVTIYLTGGSNRPSNVLNLGTFHVKDNLVVNYRNEIVNET